MVVSLTFFATSYLNLKLLSVPNLNASVIAIIFSMAAVAGLIRLRSPLSKALGQFVTPLERLKPRVWILLVIAIAVTLRLLWYIIFNAPLRSDFATYFGLAKGLIEYGSYGSEVSGRAYWPPGLPFFLTPFIAIFGPYPWILVLVNLLLSTLTVIFTYLLAKSVADETTGKVASLLMAIWPSHVMGAGLASKEQLVLALITGVLVLFIKSVSEQGKKVSWEYAFGAGLLLGWSTLTQPSFMLFPSTLFLIDLVWAKNLRFPFLRMLVLTLGLIAVVAPWTIRNYEVFGQFIPVSTNGGDVFYRANNPLANGSYIERGEIDLSHLGELDKNRIGYQLGKEWIWGNFPQFLALAVQKQIAFLGDDSIGAYETLKRGLGIEGGTFIFFKGICNAFWLAISMLIFLGWLTRRFLYQTPGVAILTLSVIYLLAIDSIFESGSRHHVPISSVLAILAAFPFSQGLKLDSPLAKSAFGSNNNTAGHGWYLLRQFMTFAMMGGIATAVHYAVLIGLVNGLVAPPVLASVVGYLTGAATNYVLNYKITFRSHKRHQEAFTKFFIVAASGLGLNTVIMVIGTEWLSIYYLFSQILATILVLIWNFTINRAWTFKESSYAIN